MHPHDREPISPELVLVDPELAARVRPIAVAGPALDPVAALRTVEPATPQEPAPTAAQPKPATPPHAPAEPEARRTIAGRLASMAATLAVLALLAAAFLPPRDAPRLTDVAAPATAAPRPSVTLAWQPARDADYYLVELFRGTNLVHAQSVRTTHVVAPNWLRPGRYAWRVFAGQGRPTARATRGPLESGWFLVRP